jgi:adenylate kinase
MIVVLYWKPKEKIRYPFRDTERRKKWKGVNAVGRWMINPNAAAIIKFVTTAAAVGLVAKNAAARKSNAAARKRKDRL